MMRFRQIKTPHRFASIHACVPNPVGFAALWVSSERHLIDGQAGKIRR